MCAVRPVFALLLVAGLPATMFAANTVTLLLDFDNDYSAQSISEMKREMEHLLDQSGIQLEFRLRDQMSPTESLPNLVVVKFKGRCTMQPLPYLYDERGPLAFTHSSDGVVLPFSEVECNRVRNAVDSALWGGQRKNGDTLFGRALGRVLAHELYHVLGNTRGHSHRGVAKTELSGSQLIADELGFDDDARDAVRARH